MEKNEKVSKLSMHEKEILERKFYLPGWQFDALISSHCTHLEEDTIHWQAAKPVKATIYGLQGIFTESKKPCIANFFVHFESRTYQCYRIDQALRVIELLKKEAKYDEYMNRLWKQKDQERQKKISARKKQKQLLKKVA